MKSWRRISKSKFSWRPSGTKSDDGDEVSLSAAAAAATGLEDHSEEGAVDDLLIAVSSASRHLTAFENGLFYGILGLRCFAQAMAIGPSLTLSDPKNSPARPILPKDKRSILVLCLVTDETANRRLVRIYDLHERELLWERDARLVTSYRMVDSNHSDCKELRLTTSASDAIAFAVYDPQEGEAVRQVLAEKWATHPVSIGSKTLNRARTAFTNIRSKFYTKSEDDDDKGADSDNRDNVDGSWSGNRKQVKRNKSVRKSQIGLPYGFQHIAHVGYDGVSGMDSSADNSIDGLDEGTSRRRKVINAPSDLELEVGDFESEASGRNAIIKHSEDFTSSREDMVSHESNMGYTSDVSSYGQLSETGPSRYEGERQGQGSNGHVDMADDEIHYPSLPHLQQQQSVDDSSFSHEPMRREAQNTTSKDLEGRRRSSSAPPEISQSDLDCEPDVCDDQNHNEVDPQEGEIDRSRPASSLNQDDSPYQTAESNVGSEAPSRDSRQSHHFNNEALQGYSAPQFHPFQTRNANFMSELNSVLSGGPKKVGQRPEPEAAIAPSSNSHDQLDHDNAEAGQNDQLSSNETPPPKPPRRTACRPLRAAPPPPSTVVMRRDPSASPDQDQVYVLPRLPTRVAPASRRPPSRNSRQLLDMQDREGLDVPYLGYPEGDVPVNGGLDAFDNPLYVTLGSNYHANV